MVSIKEMNCDYKNQVVMRSFFILSQIVFNNCIQLLNILTLFDLGLEIELIYFTITLCFELLE